MTSLLNLGPKKHRSPVIKSLRATCLKLRCLRTRWTYNSHRRCRRRRSSVTFFNVPLVILSNCVVFHYRSVIRQDKAKRDQVVKRCQVHLHRRFHLSCFFCFLFVIFAGAHAYVFATHPVLLEVRPNFKVCHSFVVEKRCFSSLPERRVYNQCSCCLPCCVSLDA